jgi:hypothetical protein
LNQFAVYLEHVGQPYQPPNAASSWQELDGGIAGWDSLFYAPIHAHAPSTVLRPVNGVVYYERTLSVETADSGKRLQTVELVLEDLSVCVSHLQYYSMLALLDTYSRYQLRMPYRHLRPCACPRAAPAAWWKYAIHVVMLQSKLETCSLSKVSRPHSWGWG